MTRSDIIQISAAQIEGTNLPKDLLMHQFLSCSLEMVVVRALYRQTHSGLECPEHAR